MAFGSRLGQGSVSIPSFENTFDSRYLKLDATNGPLTGNLNFNGLKAIAMASDSGSTLPSAPTVGQWFLHTPTGRQYLYQWNGSAWTPIVSLSAATLYVDFALGSDTQNSGWGTGANAYASIQYACDQIPPIYSGAISVSVAAGTAAATFVPGNKYPVASETITITGATTTLATITPTGGIRGTLTAPGTIILTGAGWTANQFQNKILFGVSGANANNYRIIDSNTNDTLTLCGVQAATPLNTDVYTILDWASFLDINSGQSILAVNGITTPYFITTMGLKGGGSSFSINVQQNPRSIILTACWCSSYSNGNALSATFGNLRLTDCFIDCTVANIIGIQAQTNGFIQVLRPKVQGKVGNTNIGINAVSGAAIVAQQAPVVDTFGTGIKASSGGVINLAAAATTGVAQIRNCTLGYTTNTQGIFLGVTSTVAPALTNCGKNVVEGLDSFGYITGTGPMQTTYDVQVNKNLTWTGQGNGVVVGTMDQNRNVPLTTPSIVAPLSPGMGDFWLDLN